MNRRMGERMETGLMVTLYTADHGSMKARLEDISLSGARVHCKGCTDVELHTPVEIWLQSRDAKGVGRVHVPGFVVRRSNGRMGIMFMQEMVWLVQRLRLRLRAEGRAAAVGCGLSAA